MAGIRGRSSLLCARGVRPGPAAARQTRQSPTRSPVRAHQLIFNFTNNLICRVASTTECSPYGCFGAPRALRAARSQVRDQQDRENNDRGTGPQCGRRLARGRKLADELSREVTPGPPEADPQTNSTNGQAVHGSRAGGIVNNNAKAPDQG